MYDGCIFYTLSNECVGLIALVITLYIVIEAAIVLFLLVFDTVLFVTLGYWIIDTYIVPIIIVISIVMVDLKKNIYFYIFFARFTIIDHMWDRPENALNSIIWLIVIGIMLIVVGCFMAEKKEFIGESSISR